MAETKRLAACVLTLTAALLMGACGGSPASESSPKGDSVLSGSALASGHPDPLVTVQLENGNVVAFYDFPSGVLVSESGKAYTPPLNTELKHLIRSNRLVDFFISARPDLSVPPALSSMQEKLGSVNSVVQYQPSSIVVGQSSTEGTVTGAATGVNSRTPLTGRTDGGGTGTNTSGGGRGIQPDNPCSNGCCDDTWLRNNICFTNYDYSWYLLDYEWSTEDSTSIASYDGYACAAVGTSTYSVNMQDGSGGTWSVLEGTYTNFWWLKCEFCFNSWEHSKVNSSSNQHLHTFCGGVIN